MARFTGSGLAIQCLGVLLITTWRVPCTGAYYHLATPLKPCPISAKENSTVDLVCKYSDKDRANQPCDFKSISWQRLSMKGFENVTDSAKYGIWPITWGLHPGEHMSLLRVRDLNRADIGLYRCRIICSSDSGKKMHLHEIVHQADVCMNRGDSGTSICNVHPSMEGKCHKHFWNGMCDNPCDNEANLYDGFDCVNRRRYLDFHNDDYCKVRYANGRCDSKCNTVDYAFDGGDCINKPLTFADDTIVIHLSEEISVPSFTIIHFAREISKLLRTIARVHQDRESKDGIYPWSSAQVPSPRRGGHNHYHTFTKNTLTGSVIYLKLDNSECTSRCFSNAGQAAKFIATAIRDGWDPGIPLLSLGVLTTVKERCPLENNTLLHIRLQENTKPRLRKQRREETAPSPPLWVIIATVVIAVLAIGIFVLLVLRAYRLGKVNKANVNDRDIAYIRANKEIPPGEDV